MSNPIGNAGSAQAPGVGSAPASSGAAASGSVSSGYSADNSVSHAGASAGGVSDGVALDNPGDSPLNSRNYLAQAVQTKLQALKAVVALNANIPDDQIDLSDTQNLLLSLRGTLNDIRVLSGVATLSIRSLQFQQTQQLSSATPARVREIRANIADLQSSIDSKKSQADSLENNGGSQSSIDSLRNEVVQLEAQKQGEEMRLVARQALAIVASDIDRVTREMPVVRVRSSSKTALHTGEEQLDELKRELQMLDIRFAKEDIRAVLASQILAEFNRNLARESDRLQSKEPVGDKGAVIVPPSLRQSLPDLLPAQLVSNLFSFYAMQNPRQLSPADGDPAPAPQSVIDAAQGLALVLATRTDADVLAKPESAIKPSQSDPTPAPTASEENPVDQPILGDNLSLEGANNPQAFTLLLLKERMADLEEALSKNADGSVLDSAGVNQLAQLLEQEREVDAMVAEAIKDSERAEEAIRRASKA